MHQDRLSWFLLSVLCCISFAVLASALPAGCNKPCNILDTRYVAKYTQTGADGEVDSGIVEGDNKVKACDRNNPASLASFKKTVSSIIEKLVNLFTSPVSVEGAQTTVNFNITSNLQHSNCYTSPTCPQTTSTTEASTTTTEEGETTTTEAGETTTTEAGETTTTEEGVTTTTEAATTTTEAATTTTEEATTTTEEVTTTTEEVTTTTEAATTTTEEATTTTEAATTTTEAATTTTEEATTTTEAATTTTEEATTTTEEATTTTEAGETTTSSCDQCVKCACEDIDEFKEKLKEVFALIKEKLNCQKHQQG